MQNSGLTIELNSQYTLPFVLQQFHFIGMITISRPDDLFFNESVCNGAADDHSNFKQKVQIQVT